MNDCAALRPSGSVAVTVTVAVPVLTAVSVTLAPAATAVNTSGADDDTANVNASPSGSTNARDTSTSDTSPGANFTYRSAPDAAGGRLPAETVAVKDCEALRPPGSVAVTVTVAAPAATPVSVTRAPATDAVTTLGADDDTANVNGSSSGSTNDCETSTTYVPSTPSGTPGSAPDAAGGRLPAETVAVKDCEALRPPGSVAVTVTVAAPAATPVSVTRAPATDAVTTLGADDDTANVNGSSSGSTNDCETSTTYVPSTPSGTSASAPDALGRQLAAEILMNPHHHVPLRPAGSVAVTTTDALPAPTAVSVTWVPATNAVNNAGVPDLTDHVNGSPSGSTNHGETSTTSVSPTLIVMFVGGSVPVFAGGRLAEAAETVAVNSCTPARPLGSVAYTFTFAVPGLTAVSVTWPPAADTVTTLGSWSTRTVVVTLNVNGSSSGSTNACETSTTSVSPTVNVTSGSAPDAAGGRLVLLARTVTVNDSEALRPKRSIAVTVTLDTPTLTDTRRTLGL